MRSVKELDQIHELLEGEFHKVDAPIMDLMAAQSVGPYRILVGTMLSARTKDGTTARACERIFGAAPTIEALASLSVEQIQSLIYPVCYYRMKAQHLQAMTQVLAKQFNNVIPHTVDELVLLPGVGRKTANLVVALAFGLPAICVDTHVHRINNLLGIVKTKTPLETEMALRKRLPERLWLSWNSIFVAFGQTRCRAIGARCEGCPVQGFCKKSIKLKA